MMDTCLNIFLLLLFLTILGISQAQYGSNLPFCSYQKSKIERLQSPTASYKNKLSNHIKKWRKKVANSRKILDPPTWVVYGSAVDSELHKLTYDEYKLNIKFLKLKANLEDASKYCMLKNSPNPTNDFECPSPTDTSHNGKCFRATMHETDDVTYEAALTLCSEIGWKLANIYGATHYVKIARYFRDEITTPNATAWLGMSYDPQTQILRYSSGEPASKSDMILVPTTFTEDEAFTRMAIGIHRLSSEKSEIYNSPQEGVTMRGALCEYPL